MFNIWRDPKYLPLGGRYTAHVSRSEPIEHPHPPAAAPTKIYTQVVDNLTELYRMLAHLTRHQYEPPSLYFYLEGAPLSREGSVSLISLYVRPLKMVYIIDVHTLPEALTYSTPCDVSIKSILESTYIPKVFYDVRRASDALYNLHNIKMACVMEVRIMKIARYDWDFDTLSEFRIGVHIDTKISKPDLQEWFNADYLANCLINPEKGGSYEVLKKRPIPQEIINNCMYHVWLLPEMYDVHNINLEIEPFWHRMAREATVRRIRDTKTADYDEDRRTSTLLPWDKDYLLDRRDEYMAHGEGIFDVCNDIG